MQELSQHPWVDQYALVDIWKAGKYNDSAGLVQPNNLLMKTVRK
ncbi:hypothetical protein [Bartonella rattaustraliani]|nr:hypothetical protein [Bartonella rattaustraliani]